MARFIYLTGALVLVGWGFVLVNDGQDANRPQRVIEGRVVDAAAAPVGASVVLRADDDVIQPNGVIAHTGADGRYSADVSKHDWATSKIRCRALAPGFAFATGSLEAGAGRATVDFTLKAERWKTTEVRLADATGRPGVGVAVSGLVDDLPWQTLKTDGAGRCVVNMAIGQAIWLETRPEASRPIRAILLNTEDAPATVSLPMLGPIAGRIHDKAGQPLAGITVGRLINEGEKGLKVDPHFFSETVTTGPDGQFAYAPTVMLKDRDLGGRPGRKPLAASICFADQSCTRARVWDGRPGRAGRAAGYHPQFCRTPLAVVALHDQSVQSRAEYDRQIAFARKAMWSGEDLPFRVLLDRPDPDKPADRDPEGTGVMCKRYGIVGFPTLFVIDQEGKIVAPVRHGDHAELERLVEGLLGRAAGGDAK